MTPIKKEFRHFYGKDWQKLSASIRQERAQNHCEFCGAENHKPHPITRSKVILTVAHLDQNPENNDPANLRALCQRCHLSWDVTHHQQSARTTRHKKRLAAGQIELIPREEP